MLILKAFAGNAWKTGSTGDQCFPQDARLELFDYTAFIKHERPPWERNFSHC